jgi:hypothetical protein
MGLLTLIYWWFIEPATVIGLTYLLVAYASRWMKRKLSFDAKVGWAFLVGFPLWVMLPAWDTVVGKKKFEELCASDSGVKVFRPVILPKEQIGPDGLPVFYEPFSKKGLNKVFGEKYRRERREDWVWTPAFSDARVRRDIESLYDTETKELLGQRVMIHFRSGGVPLIIMADKWLTCPVEKSERTFGEILGKAVFQTDATGLEKTK